ncbi:MAG: hypothetical protein LC808_11135, partial [Actinobacteria bacterium]|nr:hypothetical protein [Actinomycetota bacterium]
MSCVRLGSPPHPTIVKKTRDCDRACEKTHEVAERLRGAAKNAPTGMALKDMAGRVLWSNLA